MALCYGWIDGQTKRSTTTGTSQRFTPRRARSNWSKINRDKAEALIESGAMQPAGLAEVERAKADGRWDARTTRRRRRRCPTTCAPRSTRDPAASEFFEQLDGNNRYAILYRIQDAKRADTRARRIEKFVAMLEPRRDDSPPRRAAR